MYWSEKPEMPDRYWPTPHKCHWCNGLASSVPTRRHANRFRSSVGLEQCTFNAQVVGSSPTGITGKNLITRYEDLMQLLLTPIC